jgi:DNA polymerase-3 subunit chi
MTEVFFYHLERARLEAVLPDLLEKTLERGWRAVVRAASRERVEQLDGLLWTYREDSFLPHAAGGADGARQPVWLTDGEDAPNRANVMFAVDGAAMDAGALGAYERCVTIFDGSDADAVKAARALWRQAKEAGHAVAYWRQSAAGRWEKEA